jgi:hypothetical protein
MVYFSIDTAFKIGYIIMIEEHIKPSPISGSMMVKILSRRDSMVPVRNTFFPVYSLLVVSLLCLLITHCLTDSDPDDPVPPNIHGKWRTWYQDTANNEDVDIEKFFDFISDSTYKYEKITYGTDKIRIEQTGDWSVISDRIHMVIDKSYIEINNTGLNPFTPDTNIVERIFSLSNDTTLLLSLFMTYINDEGKQVFVPTTTYTYIKQ